MIFVVGGLASGKRTYLRSLGFEVVEAIDVLHELAENVALVGGERSVLKDVIAGKAVANVHEIVRLATLQTEAETPAQKLARQLMADPQTLVEALSSAGAVSSVEVGCGIVPLDAGERAWRESSGRLNEALASHAESVVRMVCGIPCVLKP